MTVDAQVQEQQRAQHLLAQVAPAANAAAPRRSAFPPFRIAHRLPLQSTLGLGKKASRLLTPLHQGLSYTRTACD